MRCWKIRLLTLRVRSQSFGTTSARKWVNVSSRRPWRNRLTIPLTYRFPSVRKLELDRDALAEDLVEGDGLRLLGEELQLEVEELGDPLVTLQAREEKDVRPERRPYRHRPVRLRVARHRAPPSRSGEGNRSKIVSQAARRISL